MANDREVLRMIWEGQLAVCFQMDTDEYVGLQQPENFYLMVSRLSYLPLVTDKVKKYFSRFVDNDSQDVWFDYNGTPLKLHFPIGVLYDLLVVEKDAMPWTLTIHFSKFPEDAIVKFTTRDVLESHFMSCLKEADVLKHRGQIISTMQKKDHNQLWLGLLNDKFDQFWAINRRLMECNGENEFFRHIPLRLYEDSLCFTQRLISPLNESSQRKTLQHLMDELSTPERKAVSCRTHGVDILAETPLQWMSQHLSYPDNFLHLIISYENISATA